MAAMRMMVLFALCAFSSAVCMVSSCDATMVSLANDFTCDTEERCQAGVAAQVGVVLFGFGFALLNFFSSLR